MYWKQKSRTRNIKGIRDCKEESRTAHRQGGYSEVRGHLVWFLANVIGTKYLSKLQALCWGDYNTIMKKITSEGFKQNEISECDKVREDDCADTY